MSQGDQPVQATVDRQYMQVLLRGAIVAVILGGIGAWVYMERSKPPLRTELSKGEQALVVKDMKTAEQVADVARRRAPNAPETLVYLAQVEMRKEKYDDALAYLKKVPAGTPDTVSARGVQARITMVHLRDFLQAEGLFREALLQDPNNEYALENFAALLLATGRMPEYQKTELHLLKLGHPSMQRLAMLNMADVLSTDNKLMEDILKKHPDDYTAHLGLADWYIRRNNLDAALEHLKKVVKLRPDLLDAQADLGQVYLLKQDAPAFVEWNRLLSEKANEHPKIWTVRGDWAMAQGQHSAAMRCYWEALKIEGAQIKPAYQLGLLLLGDKVQPKSKDPKELDTVNAGLKFLALAVQLHSYTIAIREQAPKLNKDSDSKDFMAFAAAAKKIGLYLEAMAWLEIDHFAGHEEKASEEMYKEIKTAIGGAPLLRVHPSQNPALQFDLAHLPLPDMTVSAKTAPAQAAAPSPIKLEDQAEAAGVKFEYFNGGNPKSRGPGRVSEMLGGGIAVLDFDQDGLPDLYLTQGCAWPVPQNQTQHLDRLYRNRGDGQFEDVTAVAGIVEDRFSQGVSAGDYNNDGFPDLYIANIGRNRLYLNNGDGTFSDVSSSSGTLAGDYWTTSCAIADINGDNLPDLYSVNFVTNDALKADCRGPAGCQTAAFNPAPDQVFQNLGRGTFRDITKSIALSAADGRGTSLMVGDMDNSGRMAVMLGQEANVNACFVNITKPGQPPRFDQRSWVMGLALTSAGYSPSPFGIATGDVNNDGLLDLLTTNRIGQATTLYLNRTNGKYEDVTLEAQLRDPTFKINGFGAQFVDFDLDGNLDFIQANGDTSVSADPDVSYELPTMAFRNVGEGRFQALKADELGKYFAGKYSGRSVARVDWNQDGLDDVVVSHLKAPVALLTNTTKDHGNFLKIQLRGVTSTRDAIGATVKIKIGDRTFTRQLTAGDGFQASNERVLNFGLGKAAQIDEIQIKWPTGQEQKISKVDGNRSILVIEGKETPIVLWKKG